MSKINTTEVVALLRKILKDQGPIDPTDAVAERFPHLTVDQYRRALDVWQAEIEVECEEATRKYEKDMRDCEEAEHIFEGLVDVNFGEAVAIKAAQGDPIALKWQRAMATKESRTRSALLDATVDLHPDWSREGHIITWNGVGVMPSEDQMLDWIQMNHPKIARAIEDAIEAA
jgi:hypothetical protein